MTYKTLVTRNNTKYQTFLVYEETIGEWCECNTPLLYPITATLDDLKKHYRNTNFDGVEMVTIQLTIIE